MIKQKNKKLSSRIISCMMIMALVVSLLLKYSSEPLNVKAASDDYECEKYTVSDDFSSAHAYEDYSLMEWDYTNPTSVDSLKITFSDSSETEEDYDYVYIVTESGYVFVFNGDFSGQSITVKGDQFRVYFHSDYTVTGYGFDLSVEPGSVDDVSYSINAPEDIITPDNIALPLFLQSATSLGNGYIESSSLSTIIKLNLSAYKLSSVPDLSAFTSLEGLDLTFNEFSTLSGDIFPDTLEYVYFDCNKITSISGLILPEGLTYFDIEYNLLPYADKDAIYTQLQSLMVNGKNLYIGYQGPFEGSTRADSIWYGYYNDKDFSVSIKNQNDTSYSDIPVDTEYKLDQTGTYIINAYYDDYIIYKMEALEEEYKIDAGDTAIQAQLNAGMLQSGLLDEERMSDNLLKSEILLSMVKNTDTDAIQNFTVSLSQIDTRRDYILDIILDDGEGDIDISDYQPDYTDTVLDPVALTSTDLVGVPCLIPISDTDATKNLKLSVDGEQVDFTIITENDNKYVSFIMKQLGDYRLYAANTETTTVETTGASNNTATTAATSSTTTTESTVSATSPATGDNNSMSWAVLAGSSLMIAIVLECNKRRKTQN